MPGWSSCNAGPGTSTDQLIHRKRQIRLQCEQRLARRLVHVAQNQIPIAEHHVGRQRIQRLLKTTIHLDRRAVLVQNTLVQSSKGRSPATAKKADQALLLQSIRIGAKEFFPQPIKDDDVKQALIKYREGTGSDKRIKLNKVINVMGGKGGVGTTTIAVNLATSLVEGGGKSVALVDMNMATGETPLFLDMRPGYHWGEIFQNINRLDPTFIMNILSKHSSGVFLFSSQHPGHEDVSPEAVERLLNIMRRMFDFVVIDSGQLLDPISQEILKLSDIVL